MAIDFNSHEGAEGVPGVGVDVVIAAEEHCAVDPGFARTVLVNRLG